MSDHNERACTKCGSLTHHEDDCPKSPASRPESLPEQAKRITGFRKKKGLTQVKLAKKLGVRQATVSDWENGVTKPSRLALLALSYIGYR